MSKKKKKEEALKAERARIQAQAKATPRVIFAPMNVTGPVPIAPPARNIQLTPIVQPIAMVPYSSQQQPVYAMDDTDDDFDY